MNKHQHTPYNIKLGVHIVLVCFSLAFSSISFAKSKIYSEEEFLRAFNGKPAKTILASLGAPVKKDISVKPSGADALVTSKLGPQSKSTSNKVNVTMWYYKNIVSYDGKHTYKETELTFVNDRCMNVAFFNNR